MGLDPTVLGIVAALVPLAAWSVHREVRRQRRARLAVARAREQGLDEPVSLHPIIDIDKCVGCGTCVHVCPEGDILMLVGGRSRLVNAAHCVGHGACAAACPQEAIELVFGTARRGIQLPEVGPDYQTNVPGIYIAGELGGMGLIRNAISQGVQAVENLGRDLAPSRDPEVWDVVVVGAGPAGLAAGLACRARGLRAVILDQEGLGGSVNHYPRRKLVMTAPATLPLVGRMQFKEIGKEELLRFWQDVVRRGKLELRAPERVQAVHAAPSGFTVESDRNSWRAQRVLLAIGRRGTPRKLGAPGEDSPQVAYRLLEPEPWAGRPVLVVGAGNSAVEAAVSLAEAGARTTLAVRGREFPRVAPANLERLEAARGPRLEVLYESRVQRIEPGRVRLETPAGERELPNDQVFVLIGGELPTDFLAKIGVSMQWHHGQRGAAVAREEAR